MCFLVNKTKVENISTYLCAKYSFKVLQYLIKRKKNVITANTPIIEITDNNIAYFIFLLSFIINNIIAEATKNSTTKVDITYSMDALILSFFIIAPMIIPPITNRAKCNRKSPSFS